MRRWHSVKKGKAEKTDRVRDMYALTGVACFKQPFPSSLPRCGMRLKLKARGECRPHVGSRKTDAVSNSSAVLP